MNCDLIIVGAGAAGLMAAAIAGELGVRVVLLERKHKPGRKLLMCGNNRCNLSHNLMVGELVDRYGDCGEFLRVALQNFSPELLRKWFSAHGLKTDVHKDGRIFPASEKADDVLHLFTDLLRELQVPVIYNCPITDVKRVDDGFVLRGDCLELYSPNILLATGGVSYPKTGSVGDGQKFASRLGHKLKPYSAGLAGIELAEQWLFGRGDNSFLNTEVRLMQGGRVLTILRGEILCSKRCARGPVMVNASSFISKNRLKNVLFEVDLFPDFTVQELKIALQKTFSKRMPLFKALAGRWLPVGLVQQFLHNTLQISSTMLSTEMSEQQIMRLVTVMKGWQLHMQGMRPLKEAMVTIGGVELASVDSQSMQSEKCKGLYFAGEVLDIDGPTGGFNLQAAFATARLAVEAVSKTVILRKVEKKRPQQQTKNKKRNFYNKNARTSHKKRWR